MRLFGRYLIWLPALLRGLAKSKNSWPPITVPADIEVGSQALAANLTLIPMLR
jgi:hypothetical protein